MFPAAPHLPDEIISEILSPALTVDDDRFTQSLDKAPFVQFSESTSAYLVVCKAWLRVATPLLYNVVIIRSTAQARALATALGNNPLLGSFIRKLRVEGGYGASMEKVLANAPNITDLFLAFNMYSADKTDGLCKGLERVSPRRVIFDLNGFKSNNANQGLAGALVSAIPKWDRLVCLDISAASYLGASRPFLSRAIAGSKTLTHIVVADFSEAEYVYEHSKQCPLRVLEIKSEEWHAGSSNDGRIKAKLKADDRPIKLELRSCPAEKPRISRLAYHQMERNRRGGAPYTIPDLPLPDPSFHPMATAPLDVQKHIWSRILSFTLVYRDELHSVGLTDLFLTLKIYGVEKTDGLCKGLVYVNPRRLILDMNGFKSNRMTQGLGDALVAAIPKWDRLIYLDISNSHLTDGAYDFGLNVVAASKTLTHIVLGSLLEARDVYNQSKQCPLRVLEIKLAYDFHDGRLLLKGMLKKDERPIKLDIRTSPRINSRILVPTQTTPVLLPPSNPFFRPMAAAPLDVQRRIWSHILSLVSPNTSSRLFWYLGWSHADRRPHNLLFVSKLFLAAGTEVLYRNVELTSLVSWVLLARTLESKPAYARYIQSVSLTDRRQEVPPEGNGMLVYTFVKTGLPSLRHLTLQCNLYCRLFLFIHGDRLATLRVSLSALRSMNSDHLSMIQLSLCVLDGCPNLTALTIDGDLYTTDAPPTVDVFDAHGVHLSLHTLKFNIYRPDLWAVFFTNLATQVIPRSLPVLREVILDADFRWPTTERDINKNPWVCIADRLIAAGVRVTNRDGTRWRTRLRATKRKLTNTAGKSSTSAARQRKTHTNYGTSR